MKEVAGAVVATSLVLVAVFVPVAFFPGTTGILFRQFALTIAFAVSISAFNALTLTPALSAIFLGHSHTNQSPPLRRLQPRVDCIHKRLPGFSPPYTPARVNSGSPICGGPRADVLG